MNLHQALDQLDQWSNQIVHGIDPFKTVKLAILTDKIEAPLKVCEFLCREGIYLTDEQAGRLAAFMSSQNAHVQPRQNQSPTNE